MIDLIEKFRISSFVFILIGLPGPLTSIRGLEVLLFVYIIQIFNFTKFCVFWILSHLSEYPWNDFSWHYSGLILYIDHAENVLHCLNNIVLPVLSISLYRQNTHLLQVLQQNVDADILGRVPLFFNCMSVLSCVFYFGVAPALANYEIIRIFAFIDILYYLLFSFYHIVHLKILINIYKDIQSKLRQRPLHIKKVFNLLDNTDEIQFLQHKYFAGFGLVDYVLLKIVLAFSLYFLFYRVSIEKNFSTSFIDYMIRLVIVHVPYFSKFYAWKMCSDVNSEVSTPITFINNFVSSGNMRFNLSSAPYLSLKLVKMPF